MKRALISVSDKTGIVDLARELADLGIEIVSTGGTAALLQQSGLPVIPVSDVTGYPECLDGRVKTLHPKIHGGILAIRANPDHMAMLDQLGITPIDLVVINLYPFKATVLKPGVRVDECIENIDIGGPGMLRAAAKNHGDVTVLVDPADYATVLGELRAGGATTPATRLALARKVFEHTAAYDALIAGYFRQIAPAAVLPAHLTLTYERVTGLRYGENPHQTADLYREALPVPGSLAVSEQLNGKELSYNNLADTDAAIALLREFTEPTVVAVKHANPCGVGSADTLLEAWRKAYDADPVSIFGGIVALNCPVDLAVAQATKGVFLEVMIAPDYTPEALAHLQERQNLRVMRLPSLNEPVASDTLMQKQILGGLLIQGPDDQLLDPAACRTVTRVPLDPAYQTDLLFALKVVKHTRSNAIVLARDSQTVGIGNGQPNRITSVEIAVKNAGSQAAGSVMASDAFFPFDDCVRAAAAAGVAAIVQPGGSVRDQASIDACDELGLPMLFTGIRHFRH